MCVGRYPAFQSKTSSLSGMNTAVFAVSAVLSLHIANIGLLFYGTPTQACTAALVCVCFSWSMLEAADS